MNQIESQGNKSPQKPVPVEDRLARLEATFYPFQNFVFDRLGDFLLLKDNGQETPDACNGQPAGGAVGELDRQGIEDHKAFLADLPIFQQTDTPGVGLVDLPEAIRTCLFDCLRPEALQLRFFPQVTLAVRLIAKWLIVQVDEAHVFDEDKDDYKRLNKTKFMIDFFNLLQNRRPRPDLEGKSLNEILGRFIKTECSKRGTPEFQKLRDCFAKIIDKLEDSINFV